MTLREFARRLGVSAPFISYVERDRCSLSPKRKLDAARILGVDAAVLEASEGYTRELAHWIRNSPDLIALLRKSRAS